MCLIRSAIPGDEPAIHEAHMRSIREVCARDHSEDEIRGWGHRPLGNRWSDAIKNGFVWVVESDTNIYGHAYMRCFEEDGQKRAHIHGLYLTPEVLGQGLGLKLANLMLTTAKEQGVQKITLESTLTAHGFYQRLGFKDVGEMQSADIGGSAVRYYPMALSWAP